MKPVLMENVTVCIQIVVTYINSFMGILFSLYIMLQAPFCMCYRGNTSSIFFRFF